MNAICQTIRQAVRESLNDSEPRIRAIALELLVKMGISDLNVEETIIQSVENGYYACELFYAMARAGYVSPTIVSLARDRLIHGDEYEMTTALRLLRESKDETVIPFLIQAAQSTNLSDRVVANLIRVIGEIGKAPSVDIIAFLVSMAFSENPDIKIAATVALAHLGLHKEAISRLKNLMRTSDVNRRIDIACELIDLGKQSLAYPVLYDVLKDYSANFFLRSMNKAVWYSRFLRSYKRAVVPHLRKIAQERHFWVTRCIALDSLASIGADDKKTISVCREVLQESNHHLRIEALRTLICLGVATSDDVKKLDLREEREWKSLLQRLQTMDGKLFSREIVESMVALLDHYCPNSITAQRLLFRFGVVREGSLNYLVSRLSDHSHQMREDALYALSEMWFVVGCQAG